jgi:MFS transporter, YNFM family, putative membrane transport protein
MVSSCITTPLAGHAVKRLGTQRVIWAGLAVAGIGLPLLVLPKLTAVLLGMVLVGVGTFFAQAAATGFVSHAATTDRGSASGIYLACYFMGGLTGSAILGVIFDQFGWPACVAGIGVALAAAAALTLRLEPRATADAGSKNAPFIKMTATRRRRLMRYSALRRRPQFVTPR